MEKLQKLMKNIKWDAVPSKTQKILETMIINIKAIEASRGMNGGGNDPVPKAKIPRPDGELHKIKDKDTQKAIVELWDYQLELLKSSEKD